MGCHLVARADRPEIQKLARYYAGGQAAGKPIPWVRIHKVPEYVRFPHMRHVNAGVTCQTCHGPVQQMDRVYQYASLNMGWCVKCHVNGYDPQEGLRAAGYAAGYRAHRDDPRPSASALATTARTATSDERNDKTGGRQAPRVPQGPRRGNRRGKRGRVHRRTGQAHSVPGLAGPDRPRRVDVLRDGVPRVRGRVRRDRGDARRTRHQARGESRASAEPRRAVRARSVGAPGALQSRPVPHADDQERRRVARRDVGRGDHPADAASRGHADARHREHRGLSQSTRIGKLPGLPGRLAGGVRHAAASQRRLRSGSCRDRGASSRVRRRVAAVRFLQRAAHRVVRRRLPRRLGRDRRASARLRGCARQARRARRGSSTSVPGVRSLA